MNNVQIKQYQERLSELEKFTENHKVTYSESEIIDWISGCTNLFYEIGVDQIIIQNFLDYFNVKTSRFEISSEDSFFASEIVIPSGSSYKPKFRDLKTIGPFQKETDLLRPYGLIGMGSSGYFLRDNGLYYSQIAFSAARSVLKNKSEEKRIVPLWMFEQLSSTETTKHIASQLELLETRYEKKDSAKLISESITLLGSILGFDKKLKTKGKIGAKLNALIENESIRDRFGVSDDLVRALNCGRVIRNSKIEHKKDLPLKDDVPFMVAMSFAYLTIFFLECTILTEEIFNEDHE